MPIFTSKELRSTFLGSRKSLLEQRNFSENFEFKQEYARAERLLEEISRGYSPSRQYDIFLSHSSKDAIIIYQLYRELKKAGHSVYVDWINDPLLNRASVTPATADILRNRMQNSKSFILAFSENSKASDWVQWELGYADGLKKGRVAIMPIEEEGVRANFHRQEYLGLYPYINKIGSKLWVSGRSSSIQELRNWKHSLNAKSLMQ